MGVESGAVSAVGRTDSGDVVVEIQVTESNGIFDERLVSRTIEVTMSEARFEREHGRVENGTVRYLGDFEDGEHYD